MPTFIRPASLAVLAVLLVACGGAASSASPPPSVTPSATPATSPSASPGAFGEIEHRTGATDVILRYDQGGGMMMAGFAASQAPIFTLYGDGTIIFRNPASEAPPAVGSVMPFNPFRTAKLSEEQVQALLELALGEGGLGVARPNYSNDMVADASTAIFTVNAGGLTKTVSVYALGIDGPGVQDALARAAFLKLAERLQNIDDSGAIPTDVYTPDRYRGILLEGFAGDPEAKPWPWTDVAPADFRVAADPNGFQFPHRMMTQDEVTTLGIEPYEGGFMGLTLVGPDGKPYSFALRPMLPDDQA